MPILARRHRTVGIGAIRFVEAGADARLAEGENVALDYSPRDVLLFDKASGRRLDTRVVS